MKRKIRIEDLKLYNKVILTESLNGGDVILTLSKTKANNWNARYQTTSVYHICPYDGVFRKCINCDMFDTEVDINYCKSKSKTFSNKDVCYMINSCYTTGNKVQLID